MLPEKPLNPAPSASIQDAPGFGGKDPWLGGGLGLAESVPPSEMPLNPVSSLAFLTQQVEICDDQF